MGRFARLLLLGLLTLSCQQCALGAEDKDVPLWRRVRSPTINHPYIVSPTLFFGGVRMKRVMGQRRSSFCVLCEGSSS